MSFLSASDGVYALYAPMEGLLLAFVFEAALRGFVAQTAVRSDFSFFWRVADILQSFFRMKPNRLHDGW